VLGWAGLGLAARSPRHRDPCIRAGTGYTLGQARRKAGRQPAFREPWCRARSFSQTGGERKQERWWAHDPWRSLSGRRRHSPGPTQLVITDATSSAVTPSNGKDRWTDVWRWLLRERDEVTGSFPDSDGHRGRVREHHRAAPTVYFVTGTRAAGHFRRPGLDWFGDHHRLRATPTIEVVSSTTFHLGHAQGRRRRRLASQSFSNWECPGRADLSVVGSC